MLEGSDGNRISGSRVTDASSYFGYGLLRGSDNNRLSRNTAAEVAGEGFLVGGRSKGNVLTENVARDGKMFGGLAWTGNGFVVHDGAQKNTFSGNSVIDNHRYGIDASTTGFKGDAGTDNMYEGNVCVGNHGGASNPATLCE